MAAPSDESSGLMGLASKGEAANPTATGAKSAAVALGGFQGAP
jgi:hypothetical protein